MDAARSGELSSVELTEHLPRTHRQIRQIFEQRSLPLRQNAHSRRRKPPTPASPPVVRLCCAAFRSRTKIFFAQQGLKTTCGSRMLDNFVSPYDATVVERLNAAGVVTLGKTNMDEFAMGSSNETSYYGAVRNPWDTEQVPGGSSGGSAAAVAAGLCAAATGTDTGGSVRQPAALTGLTGVKPTYGRVSRYGMIAFASSLDQAGTLTRTAEDAALLFEAMAGFDPRDSTSLNEPVPEYSRHLETPWEHLTVGVPVNFFDAGLDPDNAAVVRAALSEIEKLGATLKSIELKNVHLSVPAYYVVAPAEASSNLSRFDGVRFGHRAKGAVELDLASFYKRNRGEGFGAEVKRRILTGTYVLSAGYYDAYYLASAKGASPHQRRLQERLS